MTDESNMGVAHDQITPEEAERRGLQLWFTSLPILLACPVPVTADGRTIDDNGEPIPLEQRTERCAVWAHWTVGGQVACDIHLAEACELLGIDFDGLVLEAGREVADAHVPWAERDRSTQQDAERTQNAMESAA